MRDIVINGTSLYDTYGIILLDETINIPPEPKEEWVSIDGRINGDIDLTESLLGFPLYENREGEFTLLITSDINTNINTLYSLYHGKEVTIKLGYDLTHEFRGRIKVDSIERGTYEARVNFKFTGNPYRYLSDGQIMHNAACGYEFTCVVCDKPVMPTVTIQRDALIRVGDVQSIVTAGTWRIQNAFMIKGENKVYVDTAISDTSTQTLNDIKSTVLNTIKSVYLADLRWTSAEKAAKTSTTYNAVINWERGEL